MTKYPADVMPGDPYLFHEQMALHCAQVGADVDLVRKGIGCDAGSAPLSCSGLGYGGTCFPKDVKALVRTASEYGVEVGCPRRG